MAQLRRRVPLAGLTIASVLLSFALAPAAAAHSGIEVGKYLVEIGWRTEPTYVGQPNAVQVTINANESPVNDLGPEDLAVVVSTAGTDSPSLSFDPAFDAVEGIGPLGEYDAAIVPTAPGDYTFHVTGTIHGTAVDIKLASGDETFDPVKGSSDLEFPAKLPNLTEITTRLDRIDARIVELQGADPGSEALSAAEAAAASASDAAQAAARALLVGLIAGGAGVLLAVVALYVAVRAGRKSAGTA